MSSVSRLSRHCPDCGVEVMSATSLTSVGLVTEFTLHPSVVETAIHPGDCMQLYGLKDLTVEHQEVDGETKHCIHLPAADTTS